MDGRLLRRFPYTSVAFALALLVLTAAVFWHIDVVEFPGVNVVGIDQAEQNEITIAFLLIVPAFFVDRVIARQRAHDDQLRAEQLRVLEVTMRTVQDIVNNNLNQLQLLRLEAEGHVSDEALKIFDHVIQDTAAQLTALGNMTVFAEKPMVSGLGLDARTSA